jgi:general secretion pathway protein D
MSAGEERGKTTFLEGTGRFIGDQPASPAQFENIGGDAGVTLNLVNVPAQQAAKIVLGDILSVRYTIAPGIEGKMTVQTPKPVAKSEVIDLFQSALRANNATLVNGNGIYKIVPLDQASVGARISVTDAPRSADKVGSALHIVQLQYVSASEIRRILEPISPRGGIVRADDTRNTITLSGNDHEIAGMMDAISIFDVDVMKGMSFALVPVRISDPAVIAEELRTVFSSEREGPMAGMVQFLPNKRLGAVLIVSSQPKYLQRAETWVRRMDAQAEGSEKQFFTYAVQNRRAQEIVDVLQGMFSNETAGGRGSTQARNVAPQYGAASVQSQPMLQQSSASLGMTAMGGGLPVGGGLGTTSTGFGVTQPPQGTAGSANASRQTRQVSEVGRDETTGEPRIKLAADEAKNVILIEASPVDYRRVMRIIGTLDVIPNQVLIEAMIAEITLNDDLKFGIRSFLNGGKNSATFSDDPGGAVASVFPGFSYAFTTAKFAATLNTLNQITDVNIISSPSLTVVDGRTAVLQVGDQVPITTQSAVSVAVTTGAPIVNSVSYRDTGVILSLTPRINQSGRVLLDIEQEVSNVSTTTTSTINSPTITERRVKTSVVVNNGDALVLGGMIQNSTTITKSQIPLIGDIPIIGSALGNKDNQKAKTELIVLITPHVIRNLNEARQVTDEFRRELTASFHGSTPSRKIQESVRRIIE